MKCWRLNQFQLDLKWSAVHTFKHININKYSYNRNGRSQCIMYGICLSMIVVCKLCAAHQCHGSLTNNEWDYRYKADTAFAESLKTMVKRFSVKISKLKFFYWVCAKVPEMKVLNIHVLKYTSTKSGLHNIKQVLNATLSINKNILQFEKRRKKLSI